MASTARCQRLVTWFGENGGFLHRDIDIVESDEFGLHAIARQRLDPFEHSYGESKGSEGPAAAAVEICVCPVQLTVSHLNMSGSQLELASKLKIPLIETAVSKLAGCTPEHVISYFALMERRVSGEKSFWYPYIACLPTETELSTPLYFDEEDLQWLLGTTLHMSGTDPSRSSVNLRRKMWKDEWLAACDILKERGVETSSYTWDLFLWAATIFTSRCFPSNLALPNLGQTFSLLYPTLDSLNHGIGAKVAWKFNNGSFSLSIEQVVEKGAQVLNNYAPKGNEELLLGYGFTLPNNPCDEVTVRLGKPPRPVHEVLKSTLPSHFKSTEWSPSEATFYLRSSRHFAGGYNHGIRCLRGIPFEMFRMIAETLYFLSTGETDGAGDLPEESEQFGYVVEELLDPLKQKLSLLMRHAMEGEPKNRKQEFAKHYRDGQVEILDCIIRELEEHLAKASVA